MAQTPPTGQDLVIDILDNGVSILTSPTGLGGGTVLTIPDGSAAQVISTTFSFAGLGVSISDQVVESLSATKCQGP